MKSVCRSFGIPFLLILLSTLSSGAAPAAEPVHLRTVCYLLIEEGGSAEGNSLYLKKMALDAAALSRSLPTRFSSGARIALESEGAVRFEAEEPVLVERRGRLALYSVALSLEALALPRAQKTVTVDFSLADLARSKDLLQPADKAILLAAAKAGMRSGSAWVLDIRMIGRGKFRAKLGLAKP
jgi:hypothetical protein